jgi:hypothetical protein
MLMFDRGNPLVRIRDMIKGLRFRRSTNIGKHMP